MNPFRLVALTALATSPSFAIYAADATVAADPEPVEYVRVCDAYGAGYFFVPGTDTCLKLGGSVRFDVQAGDAIGRDVDKNMRGDSLDSRARAVVNFASASDTDVGTLKTYTELRFHWMGGWGGPNFASSGTESTGYYQVNAAFIELAGFRIGKDTSAFTTYLGYGGEVMQDWVVRYGPFDANLISYTYENGNGFSAIVSLEDDSGLGRGGLGNEGNGGGYVPNVVAGLGYDAGAFDFKVVGGYDEYKGAGAIKARMNGTIGDISGFLMAGWNTNADDGVNRYATWTGDYALFAGLSAPLTEKISFNTQVSYDQGEHFAAVANVKIKTIAGLTVTPEVIYQDNFAKKDADAWGGMFRFQRTF